MTIPEALAEMFQLTEKQASVLAYVLEYREQHGYSPTIREIMDRFRIRSTNGVLCHIRALWKKGAVVQPDLLESGRLPQRCMMPLVRFIPEALLDSRG